MRRFVVATKASPSKYLEKYPGTVIATVTNVADAIPLASNATILTSNASVPEMQAMLDARVQFVDIKRYYVNSLAVRSAVRVDEVDHDVRSSLTSEVNRRRAAQGLPLGAQNPAVKAAVMAAEGWKDATMTSAKVRMDLADQHVKSMEARIRTIRAQGGTWLTVAEELNKEGYTTRRGCAHTAASVYKAFRRLEGDDFEYENNVQGAVQSLQPV